MIDSSPLFSVVIPTYNNLELFVNAIQSVLAQTLRNFEIVVSDDSTTADIEKYCKKLNDSRLRYFRRPDRNGAVANWNTGLNLAVGKNIIVLHHDEEFVSTLYLERLRKELENNDLIISDIRVSFPDGSSRKGRINGLIKKKMLSMPSTQLIINSIGPCACVAFRRELMQPFDQNLTWLVDTEWYYRLLKSATSAKYQPELIIRSNSGHADQITLNIDINQKNHQDIRYLRTKYHGHGDIKRALAMKDLINKFRKFLRK